MTTRVPEISAELVERSRAGDAAALETVTAALYPRVYRLALRMLWHPEDAADATQEIMIRMITRLSSFRGDSAITTWVYRIAVNHLLTVRRNRIEAQGYTLERFSAELRAQLTEPAVPDDARLLEEIKIGCTLGLLQCLDRPHRLAYVLGEILGLDHGEAAAALDIAPAAYRKRLSRAREVIVRFMKDNCGLVEPANTCRCAKRAAYACQSGRVTPGRWLFARDARSARSFPNVLREIRRLEQGRRAAALYRSLSEAMPDTAAFTRKVRDLLSGVA